MSSPFDMYGLKEIDIAVLRVVAEVCDYSLSAHVPLPVIIKKVHNQVISKDVGKSLRRLHSKGLIMMHPTRGNTTYSLSPDGLRLARMI